MIAVGSNASCEADEDEGGDEDEEVEDDDEEDDDDDNDDDDECNDDDDGGTDVASVSTGAGVDARTGEEAERLGARGRGGSRENDAEFAAPGPSSGDAAIAGEEVPRANPLETVS